MVKIIVAHVRAVSYLKRCKCTPLTVCFLSKKTAWKLKNANDSVTDQK